MNTLRGRGSRAAGTLGRWDARLSDAVLDGADGKPFRSYPRCCPTGLDFFPRNHGLWPYALTANREDHMWGLRVPVCDEEHCVGWRRSGCVLFLCPRRVAEIAAGRLVYVMIASILPLRYPGPVQCGLVVRHTSLVLRMKISRVRPKKCLRSKYVGAVLWLRFIAVNAHVRGLG